MAEETGQEKTERATPRKREKAREEGQVAKSMEIASVFVLLLAVGTIYGFSGFIYDTFIAIMRHSFTLESVPLVDNLYCLHALHTYTRKFFLITAPVLIAVFVTALASNMAQVGFAIAWKAIAPKLDKISPIKGFGRIFSKKSIAELLKSIAKIVIIFGLAWYAVKGEFNDVLRLYDNSIGYILIFILKIMFKMFIWVLVVMVAVAILDYAFQKWQFEEQLKMTKQEVKDESKDTEGDPQVKSRIRQLQFEAAKKRMMAEVPKADVVVTNPTHLAVAIRYDALAMDAPQIVAKGAGPVAGRIREIAKENGVPVVENKELARNLYKAVDIGEFVPPDLFRAVAELLAYVYQLKGKTM